MVERLGHRGANFVERRAAFKAAFEFGPRHRQRRAQVVGDVVADVAQLAEQAPDLIEHQIDVARNAVDVVDLAIAGAAVGGRPS